MDSDLFEAAAATLREAQRAYQTAQEALAIARQRLADQATPETRATALANAEAKLASRRASLADARAIHQAASRVLFAAETAATAAETGVRAAKQSIALGGDLSSARRFVEEAEVRVEMSRTVLVAANAELRELRAKRTDPPVT